MIGNKFKKFHNDSSFFILKAFNFKPNIKKISIENKIHREFLYRFIKKNPQFSKKLLTQIKFFLKSKRLKSKNLKFFKLQFKLLDFEALDMILFSLIINSLVNNLTSIDLNLIQADPTWVSRLSIKSKIYNELSIYSFLSLTLFYKNSNNFKKINENNYYLDLIEDLYLIFLKLLIFLVKHQYINEKIIYIAKNKSTIYYSLRGNLSNINIDLNFIYNLDPAKLISFQGYKFFISWSLFSLTSCIKQNHLSLEKSDINLKGVNAANHILYKFDKSLFFISYEIFKKNYNLCENNLKKNIIISINELKLFSKIQSLGVILNLIKWFNNYKSEFKNKLIYKIKYLNRWRRYCFFIFKFKNYKLINYYVQLIKIELKGVDKILNNSDLIEDLGKKTFMEFLQNFKLIKVFINKFEIQEIKNINFPQKNDISKKLSYAIDVYKKYYFFKFYEKNINGFFLTHWLDFRGRQYSYSSLSPIYNVFYRSILYYGYYTNDELILIRKKLQKSKTFNEIKKYFYIIDGFFPKLQNDILVKVNLLWLLVELGKLNKSKLNNEGIVNLTKFLYEGFIIYKNSYEKKTFSESIEIEKLKYYINKISNGEELNKKIILNKDSTSSVLQHLMRILGPKDERSLEICNFTSTDNWHDPYTYIINNFLLLYKISPKSIKFFTRKYLKKAIMTVNYSATLFTTKDYFLENIWHEVLNSDGNLDHQFLNTLIQDFTTFYNFLMNEFETKLFFANPSSSLIGLNNIRLSDGSFINLNYNNFKYIRQEYFFNKKRSSFQKKKLHNSINLKKKRNADRANSVQAIDALLVRQVNIKYYIVSVHDSFSIDIARTCFLIDDINLFLKEEAIYGLNFENKNDFVNLQKGNFSIFIIL